MKNYSYKPSNSDIEIIECICCWYDLLGFGNPLIESNWNLNEKKCQEQLERIKRLEHHFPSNYTIDKCKSLSLNDGAMVNYDINKSTRNLIRIIAFVLDDVITDYESINYIDSREGHPGARGIMTFGHRYSYRFSDTAMLVHNNENMVYHPREFQMNTAFSKAYIMESSGSKAGLSGNNLYIDNFLLSKLEELIANNDNETNFNIIRKEYKNELHYKIMENYTRLLTLKFEKKPIEYNFKGIETNIYKYLNKESYQDEMAAEAEYRRAVAISEAERLEFGEDE